MILGIIVIIEFTNEIIPAVKEGITVGKRLTIVVSKVPKSDETVENTVGKSLAIAPNKPVITGGNAVIRFPIIGVILLITLVKEPIKLSTNCLILALLLPRPVIRFS